MTSTIDIYIPPKRRRSDGGIFLTTLKGLRAQARNPVPKRPRVQEHDAAIPPLRTPNQYKGAYLERYEEPCACDVCSAKRTSDVFEENKHPRGQPDNAGQFSKGGGNSTPVATKLKGQTKIEGLTEGKKLGDRQLDDMVKGGVYNFKVAPGRGDNYKEVIVYSPAPDGIKEIPGRRGSIIQYDPKYAQIHVLNDDEPIIRREIARLKPEYDKDIPLKRDPAKMFRGMIHEQYEDYIATGKVVSKGQYNMTGQEGLTYWSDDPIQAQSYANGFAPSQFKPTFERPCYVFVAKKAAAKDIKKVAGVGEDELGVSRAVPKEEVLEIWRGKVAVFNSGEYTLRDDDYNDEAYTFAGSSAPSADVVWEKVTSETTDVGETGSNYAPVYQQVRPGELPFEQVFENAQNFMEVVQLPPESFLPITEDDFKEGEHPRGQPENKGEFSKTKQIRTRRKTAPVQSREEKAESDAYLERMRNLPDEDGPQREQVRSVLDKLTEQYPLAGHVRIAYENYGPDSLARAGGNADYGLSISLNPAIVGDPAAMAKYEKDWDGLVVGNSLEGIVSHEFGHALSHIVEGKIGHKRFWQIFKDVYGGDGKVDLSDVTNHLNAPSAYGQENAFELMAESFNAQYYNKHAWSNPDFLKKEGADPVEKAKQLWGRWLQEAGSTKDYLPYDVPDHLKPRALGTTSTGDAAFTETDHPRGQPKNAGEFAEKAGGPKASKSAALVAAKPDRSDFPEHIKKLVLPPAWTNVHYNPDPAADLLAQGKDAKGRLQSVYSEAFAKQGSIAKFGRVAKLEKMFKAIDAKNEANRKSKLPIIRDTADVTKLIMETGIRPGSDGDTKAKVKAYGATTLLGQHVQADASGVTLDYIGKDGVHLNIPIQDKATADMVRRRAKLAGPDGKLFPTTNATKLQGYVKQLSGGEAKPKDFRTYVANSTALSVVSALPVPETEVAYKKMVREVAVKVSKKLGNTPVIALASYINPVVFSDWRAACCGGLV